MLHHLSADTGNLNQRTGSAASEAALACREERTGVDASFHSEFFDLDLLVIGYIPNSVVKVELCQVQTHSAVSL